MDPVNFFIAVIDLWCQITSVIGPCQVQNRRGYQSHFNTWKQAFWLKPLILLKLIKC